MIRHTLRPVLGCSRRTPETTMKARFLRYGVATAVAAYLLAATPLAAQSIVDEWEAARFPAPPELKAAKINAKQAVLLVMDFTTQTCSSDRRPRCAASVPKIAKLISDARAKGML